MKPTEEDDVKRLLEKLFEYEARIQFLEDFVLSPYMADESRKQALKAAKEAEITICRKEQK